MCDIFLLLPVQDKIQMHLDRMYLLLQRLRRNKNFSRPAFAGLKASSRSFIEVMPRASLVAYQLGKDTLHSFSALKAA